MNRIAKITSIFFLLSYMGVNIATLALELTSAPNFRPQFKYFSWHTCALGAIASSVMMLVIDASMSAVAVVILMFLIMILHYQVRKVIIVISFIFRLQLDHGVLFLKLSFITKSVNTFSCLMSEKNM